ncbi:MAG TPA: hypothetical protein VFI65_31920 [Streptosporangiaceae bacterium]|nr:hypothetical protein [Streptosporangiaceae bacterium]
MKAQRLSLCPSTHGRVCSVGELPVNQQFEVVVTDQIGKNATPGEQIGVTVNVQGVADTGGPLSPAEASVATVLDSPSSPSSPPPGTVPPVTIPTNPEPVAPGTTVTPGGLTGLFPTITPSSNPSGGGKDKSASSKKHGGTKIETVASSSPIDPKLIGGQLAGLAVLAAAITMVVARLSLRTPAAATATGQTVPAAPPPGPTTPAESTAPAENAAPAESAEPKPEDASDSPES